MEYGKPIVFDEGLREAFELPLKKYPTLQKAFLSDCENDNEEVVFFSKFFIPLCSVMYYLVNKDFAVFEGFVKFIEDLGEIKSIPRLDSDEIFEVLSRLSTHNALCVLERINFTDGTYTELKESLEEGDKRRFVTALKDCNTTPISPILKTLNIPLIIIQKIVALECEATKVNFESDKLLSKWAWYKVQKLFQELFGNRIKTIGSNTIRVELPEGVEAEIEIDEEEEGVVDAELVWFLYDLIIGLFSCFKGEGVLDENAINVIEYIMKQSPFEDRYQQHQDYWRNGGTDGEFLSFITRHKNHFSKELVSEITTSINDDSIEEAELIEEQTTLIEEDGQKETAADYGQIIPSELSEEQNKIIGDFDIWHTYFYKDSKQSEDHCTITNEKFNAIEADKRAKNLEAFIKLLAREYCIAPDKGTMKSCAYAFTGIDFIAYRGFHVQPVFWNKEKVDILLFICTKFFKKGKKADFVKAVKVFHVEDVYEAMQNPSKVADEFNRPKFLKEFQKIFGEL